MNKSRRILVAMEKPFWVYLREWLQIVWVVYGTPQLLLCLEIQCSWPAHDESKTSVLAAPLDASADAWRVLCEKGMWCKLGCSKRIIVQSFGQSLVPLYGFFGGAHDVMLCHWVLSHVALPKPRVASRLGGLLNYVTCRAFWRWGNLMDGSLALALA